MPLKSYNFKKPKIEIELAENSVRIFSKNFSSNQMLLVLKSKIYVHTLAYYGPKNV